MNPSFENELTELCVIFERQHRQGPPFPQVDKFVASARPEIRPELELRLRRLAKQLQHFTDAVDARPLKSADAPPSDEDTVVHVSDPHRGDAGTASFAPDMSQSANVDETIREGGQVEHAARSDETSTPDQIPQTLGRFRIDRLLGQGSFGAVYLATDTQLKREVAIKLPRPQAFRHHNEMQSFLAEARNAAGLKHPGLVAVYDIQMDDQLPFIVQEYIDGVDLRRWVTQRTSDAREIVTLFLQVVQAVGFAHQQGFIHRDLKPDNILVDSHGQAHVADFGLALHESVQRERRGEVSGSPSYMSPEQVRGETHRLDGRTDIWSLGVILYELLAGRRPFAGETRRELFAEIQLADPRPPRQIAPATSRELERICLKCLRKRRDERYLSAGDLAEDLQYWLRQEDSPSSSSNTIPAAPSTATWNAAPQLDQHLDSVAGVASGTFKPIVPKGLQSFDKRDADFFLQLLPGPRDRSGLPDSIRFWKDRLEERDAAETFSVGVIYGPSGCGKTSMVRAGLLPNLAADVRPVYIEATGTLTESRLLGALKTRAGVAAGIVTLDEAIRSLREQSTGLQKVLIVIDQFEQWLNAHGHEANSELAQALRHCDGVRVQTVLMTRDDFWMAITRFMRELEVPISEGFNSASVDLFSVRHAQQVLIQFGLAYGALSSRDLNELEQLFVSQAAQGLAENGYVISVRLAVFAEMMKDRSWTPQSLVEVGGIDGIGVTFLDETFSLSSAPPTHRLHEKGARALLGALLPEPGSNIRGHMRSRTELCEASGYHSDEDFDQLIDLLNRELRLITPTRPSGSSESFIESSVATPSEDSATEIPAAARSDPSEFGGLTDSADETFYQLTHDYLVPSLREWLTRHQISTRRGRAERLLAERSSLWQSRREKKQLPSAAEWLRLQALTRRSAWTTPQRAMMQAASRYHLLRGGMLLAVLIAVSVIGLEFSRALDAFNLTEQLGTARIEDVPKIIDDLKTRQRWAASYLPAKEASLLQQPSSPERDRHLFHVRLARYAIDGSHAEALIQRLLLGSPTEVEVLRQQLEPALREQKSTLWSIVNGDEGYSSQQRFTAACALAYVDPEGDQWDAVSSRIANHLISEPQGVWEAWAKLFEPVAARLLPALKQLALSDADLRRRHTAAAAFSRFAHDQVAQLVTLIQQIDAEVLPSVVSATSSTERAALLAECRTSLQTLLQQRSLEESGSSVTEGGSQVDPCGNLALAIHGLDTEVSQWPILEYTRDPTTRSYVIHQMARADVDMERIMAYIENSTVPVSSAEATRIRSLLLALAEVSPESLPVLASQRFIQKLRQLALMTTHADIHFSAVHLLRRWNQDPLQPEAVDDPSNLAVGEWYYTASGDAFIVIDMNDGSPGSHRGRKTQRLACGVYEITVKQYLALMGPSNYESAVSPTEDHPMNYVDVKAASAYCLTRSVAENIPSGQHCYRRVNDTDIQPVDDYHLKHGYRLLRPEEWETLCGAGTETTTFFGNDPRWASKYAWIRDRDISNPQTVDQAERVGLLAPNDLGFFDVYGNVSEWVADVQGRTYKYGGTYDAFRQYLSTKLRADGSRSPRATNTGFRICRTLPPMAP